MATARGERVGETIGYRIRHESKISAATRIEVITEGILTRMLQDNPELPDVAAILFDEFHERHLHGDLGAALARDVQATLREDLRLVIMSATLDGERIARWFDAPRLSSAGRSFPVRIDYPPPRQGESWPERGWVTHLSRVVAQALREANGDSLVFLPGRREIESARRALDGLDAELLVLHGELALSEQNAALAASASGRQRVVLATNVAESSLTLPGIRGVVDCGLAREPRFDPNSGFSRLQTVNISQASADQRAGRAGRLGPGTAYRLWPQSRRLESSRPAEILQVELSQLLLELKAWGSETLDWLDPPPSGASAQARDLLLALGGIEADGSITVFGRELLSFGAHPRLAAAVLRANTDHQALACDLVALIEARNPLRGQASRDDDFRQRLQALTGWRARDSRAVTELGADRGALAVIQQSADAWRRRARVSSEKSAHEGLTTVGDLLVHAFPDRIARQDSNNPRRYQLANGRGARLMDESSLFGEPWIVIIDLRYDERDSLILAAAPFDESVLERDFAEHFRRVRKEHWNRDARAVEVFEEHRFAGITLERRSVPAHSEDTHPALIAAVRELGLEVLPWSASAIELRQRVAFLRQHSAESNLPDFSDQALLATLESWLGPALLGKRRLDALGGEELSNALAAQLDYQQRRLIDEQAPTTIMVPSGLDRRVSYPQDAPPVLAVKLQELFGLAESPRVANGRVAVVLHLLSPAGRPIQVTQDLRGFWERTYPEVKKELKGRYPKHPWPDDPWTAVATHRAKPRR